MIGRFKESPSLRKLRKNKRAMFAMGVIGVYLFVFVWILALQGVAWVGETTGAYDLNERPVLGALLPQRTLDRVGASGMPGVGLLSEPEERAEQLRFYFDRVADALKQIDNPVEGDERTHEEIVAEKALAERLPYSGSIDELRAIHARGVALFSEQSELRNLRSKLVQIRFAIENVREYAEQYAAPTDETDIDLVVDEISLSLEEIGILLDEAAGTFPDDSVIADMDPIEFEDMAMALFDEPRPDPLFDDELLSNLEREVSIRLDTLTADINSVVADIEPVFNELYPMPDGIKGFLYKTRLLLGTDRQGRSIFIRAIYSAKVAIQVGVIVSIIAVGFGSLLGAAAGYLGGFIDHGVIWLYSTFSSIPYLVLLVVLAFMFTGSVFEGTLIPLYTAFCLTFWIGPCRVTRGEALKLRSLDYVQAANALGASKMRILLKHIIPNTVHLMFINTSLLFIGAIKGEVVLTFLGLGLKEGASWGIMINQSKSEVVAGSFWQIGAATFFMFVLVLAFNVLTDALQDAFDPKHVG